MLFRYFLLCRAFYGCFFDASGKFFRYARICLLFRGISRIFSMSYSFFYLTKRKRFDLTTIYGI
ncbi:hypothetical protein B4099_2921 [Heyndrickxia coagulans]|uniref:Uncharacterized protein n=1 Tax=Heyndrickxia coagulans TaxID=1398 RepID=A0A150KF13_HEYCO|nr:hypothetical protein B4099_2921 [Heyndrickxia coagulans]